MMTPAYLVLWVFSLSLSLKCGQKRTGFLLIMSGLRFVYLSPGSYLAWVIDRLSGWEGG